MTNWYGEGFFTRCSKCRRLLLAPMVYPGAYPVQKPVCSPCAAPERHARIERLGLR